MDVTIEVGYKAGVFDATALGIKKDIADLDIKNISAVSTRHLFHITGTAKKRDISLIAQHILCDPIVQHYTVIDHSQKKRPVQKKQYAVEVWFKKGVTDNVGESVKKAACDLGIAGIGEVHTGRKYCIGGKITRSDIVTITTRLLANSVVEDYKIYGKS